MDANADPSCIPDSAFCLGVLKYGWLAVYVNWRNLVKFWNPPRRTKHVYAFEQPSADGYAVYGPAQSPYYTTWSEWVDHYRHFYLGTNTVPPIREPPPTYTYVTSTNV